MAHVALKQGDRVKDRFKVPKEGNSWVHGTVERDEAHDGTVVVHWDNGDSRVMSYHLLERIEP